MRPYVDAHVHITSPAVTYRADVLGVITTSAEKLHKANAQDLTEVDYLSATTRVTDAKLVAAIFVEVLPASESSVDEACWVLDEE